MRIAETSREHLTLTTSAAFLPANYRQKPAKSQACGQNGVSETSFPPFSPLDSRLIPSETESRYTPFNIPVESPRRPAETHISLIILT